MPDQHRDAGHSLASIGFALSGKTVAAALTAGAEGLRQFEIDDAAGDARRLLLFVLSVDPLALVREPDRLLTMDQSYSYARALTRRAAGEPVSRILGTRGFYGRDFLISPATLDPRPETETLIDTALSVIAPTHPVGAGLDILDIGTGTGCLLITLLAELPLARGTGIDPSAGALTIAEANAASLGVADRCAWVQGRTFAGLGTRFPLIVSNPPYIATADIPTLAREVRNHDPHLALDGGPDGLDIYRAIARDLDAHAAPGWLLMEAGAGQAAAIAEIITVALPPLRLALCKIIRDMAGMPRCVAFQIH